MAIRMGDDEIIVSDYGVDELWKNLPGSAVDEILGYLDLRQLQIFSRVSRAWEDSRARCGTFNEGTVFLISPAYHGRSNKALKAAISSEKYWDKVFRLRLNTVKHFVFMGDPMSVQDTGPFYGLFSLRQPLRLVTFHSIKTNSLQVWGLSRILLLEVATVQFVKCTIQVDMFHKNEELSLFTWRAWWYIPYFTVTALTLNDVNSPQFVKMLDRLKVIWQYPREQLMWLKKALDSMWGVHWTTIHEPDRAFRQARSRTYAKDNQFRKLGVWSEGLEDGRELDTLDAAFLMRLLLRLKLQANIEVADIPNPPCRIPEDLIFKGRR